VHGSPIIAAAALPAQEITTFKSVIWSVFELNVRCAWFTMAAMSESVAASHSYSLAIIMERTEVGGRWAGEKWEAKGVVQDASPSGSAPRVIVQSAGRTQILYPGFHLFLQRDEAEGYYLNLTSPEPKVFVLWRWMDDVARPHRITVSYGEGTRWADSGEQVDGVQVPLDLRSWMAEFVEAHYRPEPQKAKRYASNRDKGRMGGPG
jgi:hypothetical protein